MSSIRTKKKFVRGCSAWMLGMVESGPATSVAGRSPRDVAGTSADAGRVTVHVRSPSRRGSPKGQFAMVDGTAVSELMFARRVRRYGVGPDGEAMVHLVFFGRARSGNRLPPPSAGGIKTG